MVKVHCRYCGAEYSTKPSRINTSNYCSIACARKGRWPSRENRFWSKVDKSDPDGCWPWIGGCFLKDGWRYGAFYDGANNRLAHHVAWELSNNTPWPASKQGNHTCDNPICCNPNHVYPGTQAENMRDMMERGRSLKGDKHPHRKHLAHTIPSSAQK